VNQDRPRQVQPLETETPDEQFEKLRRRFHERLRKEQSQLTTLTKALGSASASPAAIFSDIQAFAHRLRGAALVFGYPGLGKGAKAVELAVTRASRDAKSRRPDPSVVATMQALAINLAHQIGTAAP
jgi:HPt (histidine-containing phosphotransfer) domain-containing protein